MHRAQLGVVTTVYDQRRRLRRAQPRGERAPARQRRSSCSASRSRSGGSASPPCRARATSRSSASSTATSTGRCARLPLRRPDAIRPTRRRDELVYEVPDDGSTQAPARAPARQRQHAHGHGRQGHGRRWAARRSSSSPTARSRSRPRGDIELKADGNITIEAGQDVTVKARHQRRRQGAARARLEGSASATLKGATTTIAGIDQLQRGLRASARTARLRRLRRHPHARGGRAARQRRDRRCPAGDASPRTACRSRSPARSARWSTRSRASPYPLPIGRRRLDRRHVDGQALVRMGDQIPSGPGVLLDRRAAGRAVRHRRERAVTRRTAAEVDRVLDRMLGTDLALDYPGPGRLLGGRRPRVGPDRPAAAAARPRVADRLPRRRRSSSSNRLKTQKGELAPLGHPEYGSRHHELIGQPNVERTPQPRSSSRPRGARARAADRQRSSTARSSADHDAAARHGADRARRLQLIGRADARSTSSCRSRWRWSAR